MIDHNLMQHYNDHLFQNDPQKFNAHKLAESFYRKMCFQGFLWRIWRRLINKRLELIEFDQVFYGHQIKNSYDAGIKTIAIADIVGTINKKEVFDANFNLRINKHSWVQRWKRIITCYLMNEEIPSVDLIQVNGKYFIKDGHHRISTSRMLGRRFIDANVTVVKTFNS